MIFALLCSSAVQAATRGKIVFYNPIAGAEGEPFNRTLIPHFADENRDLEAEERPLTDSNWDQALECARQPGHAAFTLTTAIKLPALADQAAIVPMDDLAPAALWRDYYPKVMETVTYKGRVWEMPLEANPYALFCNLEHFNAAGVRIPTTWEETLEAARALTRDTNGDGKPDLYGYTQCTYQFPLELWSYGVDLVTLDGAVRFADPPAAEILCWYAKLRSYSPPHVSFERDDVAMKLSTVDDMPHYRHLDFTVVPLPSGTRHINSLGGSNSTMGMALLAGSDRELASRFLTFWSREDVYLRSCVPVLLVALRKSVRESAPYQRYLRRNPEVQVFDAELDYALPRPCMREYEPIHEIVARFTGWASSTRPTVEQCQAELEEAKKEAEALFHK